jgi:anti-anti-sigma factor
MAGKIDVQADQTPRGLVVRIIGNAAVDQVDELDRELHVLTALKSRLVVLDLAGVPFVSSMAMGSLLRFRNAVADDGGKVALCCMQKAVADSFRIAGLGKVFSIHANVEDALNGKA